MKVGVPVDYINAEHLDLDGLAWQDTKPPERVPLDIARRELDSFTSRRPEWVVERCYADLIELA